MLQHIAAARLRHLTTKRNFALIALGLPTLFVCKHAWDVYRAVSPVPIRSITIADSIPESLKASSTLKVVNPRGHVALKDSRCIDFELPAGLSDEAVLAAFMEGFFGGKVFGIERLLLQVTGLNLVHYSNLPYASAPAPASAPLHIQSTSQLPSQSLPPVGTRLFGTFMVAAVEMQNRNRGQRKTDEKDPAESYVDVVFGGNHPGSSFAGVHRFSVIRPVNEKDGEGNEKEKGDRDGDGDGNRPGNEKRDVQTVRLHFSGLACNPTVDKLLKPDILGSFHRIYAMLLFREGAAKVQELVKDFA